MKTVKMIIFNHLLLDCIGISYYEMTICLTNDFIHIKKKLNPENINRKMFYLKIKRS